MLFKFFLLISQFNIDVFWKVENIVIRILAHIAHPYLVIYCREHCFQKCCPCNFSFNFSFCLRLALKLRMWTDQIMSSFYTIFSKSLLEEHIFMPPSFKYAFHIYWIYQFHTTNHTQVSIIGSVCLKLSVFL